MKYSYLLFFVAFSLSCQEKSQNHKVDASVYVQPDASACLTYLKNYQEDLSNESLDHQLQAFKTKDISNLSSFQILQINWKTDQCSASMDVSAEVVGKAGMIQFYKDSCMSIKITPELIALLHQEATEGNHQSSDLLKLANACKVIMEMDASQ